MQIHNRKALSQLISSFALIALTFNLLFGYGAFTSYVLCIGSHDHVAVERAWHDHERESLSQSADMQNSSHSAVLSDAAKNPMQGKQTLAKTQANDQSEPCLDLPIGNGDKAGNSAIESILQHLIKIGWSLFTVVIFLIFSFQPSPLQQRPRIFETNPVSSIPALRRSAVLLI